MGNPERVGSGNEYPPSPNQAMIDGLRVLLDETAIPLPLDIMRGSAWLAERARELYPKEVEPIMHASQALIGYAQLAAKAALALAKRGELPFCDMPPIDDPGPIALQRVDHWDGGTVSLPARSTGSPRWSDIYRVSVEYRGTDEAPLIEHARLQVRLPDVFTSRNMAARVQSITIEAGLFKGRTGALDEVSSRHALAVRYRLPGAVRSATALMLTSQTVGELPPDDDAQFPARTEVLSVLGGNAVFDNPHPVASLLGELATRLSWTKDELRAVANQQPAATPRRYGR